MESASNEALTYTAAPSLWRASYAVALFFTAFLLTHIGASVGDGGGDVACTAYLAIAFAAALASKGFGGWRLTCDDSGIRVERVVLPDRAFSWDEIGSVTVDRDGLATGVSINANGRRLVIPDVCLRGEDPRRLYAAVRGHGIQCCPEGMLEDGTMGPHGLRRGPDVADVIAGVIAGVGIGVGVIAVMMLLATS